MFLVFASEGLKSVFLNLFPKQDGESAVDINLEEFVLYCNVFAQLFCYFAGNTELDPQIKEAVCLPYAASLLQMVVRHSDSAAMLEKFGARLLQICEQGKTSKMNVPEKYR